MTQFSRSKIIAQKSSTDLTSTNSRITTLENNEYKVTYYEIISGTSGSLTIPSQATINSGEFGLSGNAILSKIDGSNKPTYESPKTSGGVVVTASLTVGTGAWVTSGTYTDSNVALIYSIKIKAVYYSNLTYSRIIETVSGSGDFLNKNNNLSDVSNPLTASNNLKMWDMKLTTGDQSTTSSTASSITDLVFTPTINKRYSFQGVLHIGCAASGGLKFQVTIPTGATIWISFEGLATGATVRTWAPVQASATLTSNAFCTTVTAAAYVVVYGEVQMSSTAGDIQFGFASGTNTQSSTIYQLGTLIKVKQLD